MSRSPAGQNGLITAGLVARIHRQFLIDWQGPHGIRHWARVLDNGLRLAPLTGADTVVVTLFALFHDACRHNESSDPDHGPRAARLIDELRAHLPPMTDNQRMLLQHACRMHTAARTDPDVTVRTCFDADRLDLGRVGKIPRAELLCTEPARQKAMIGEAYMRSIGPSQPNNSLTRLAGNPVV